MAMDWTGYGDGIVSNVLRPSERRGTVLAMSIIYIVDLMIGDNEMVIIHKKKKRCNILPSPFPSY